MTNKSERNTKELKKYGVKQVIRSTSKKYTIEIAHFVVVQGLRGPGGSPLAGALRHHLAAKNEITPRDLTKIDSHITI